MLELAKVSDKDILYDIGCGDGRIVITAARRYGARGVGIDIDKAMIEESERNARSAGVEGQVKFITMDATKADISEATVVSLYLLPESNDLMRPILEAQLRPKSRVVCHNYAIPGWQAKEVQAETIEDENGEKHYIYLYER
ncbi:MAG: class I SAM-dependent methyltransferase [Candidatus Aminicenantes bacterium]|nr:MAG: class I SAM-dependent methyltransferase [Candidatus Aminicenantes bacterium]